MFLQASSEYLFSQDLFSDLYFALIYNSTNLSKSKSKDGHLSSVKIHMILKHLIILTES